MKIKILGTGCPKCQKLYDETSKAVASEGMTADIEKVQDINDIMNYGVMMTPALVIDEKVVSSGKIPSAEELKKFLAGNAK